MGITYSGTWATQQSGRPTKDVITELESRVKALEEHLPNAVNFIKYPALAEAYREYKTIETLILGKNET